MTVLIHLNGPPGIGKSTLAALYADRHPGTLDLDIDALHRLVGGWRDPANRTHDVLRPVALAMASAHLGGGRDVILPQYLARVEEIEAFETVAREQGAAFRELVLLAEREQAIARFDGRPDAGDWDEHNRRVVAEQGGPAFLAAMYAQLMDVVDLRPGAVVVRSADEAIESTYSSLLEALGQAQG